MIQSIISWFYPDKCILCKRILRREERRICDKCREALPYITGPRCIHCSKPVGEEDRELCFDCERKHFSYQKGFSLFVYQGAIKESMIDFKYRNCRDNRFFYGEELTKCFGDDWKRRGVQCIIPIPAHKSRVRTRGYNQAKLIAEQISVSTGIPMDATLLIRNKKTLPQKELSDTERLKNLTQAFAIDEQHFKKCQSLLPETVLLVDDIYTTGSTVEACSRVLMAQGVKTVYFASVCIGKGM
ncbi:MAG: ComF family protein [Lachnospiraceae bacterium]|nr:ComF family protein [Lachnospiraceae bacterium]